MVVTMEARMARNDLSVKIDAEVLKQAKIVATHRSVTVAEYLSEMLRPGVARDYRAALDEMSRAAGQSPPPRPAVPPRKGGGK